MCVNDNAAYTLLQFSDGGDVDEWPGSYEMKRGTKTHTKIVWENSMYKGAGQRNRGGPT